MTAKYIIWQALIKEKAPRARRPGYTYECANVFSAALTKVELGTPTLVHIAGNIRKRRGTDNWKVAEFTRELWAYAQKNLDPVTLQEIIDLGMPLEGWAELYQTFTYVSEILAIGGKK